MSDVELWLVNGMLATIGERTHSTLVTTHPSVTQARQVLSTESREFQLRGWWFNKETGVVLSPQNAGEVTLPAETLEFQITHRDHARLSSDEKKRYTQRGQSVWDTILHTKNIGAKLTADLTLELDLSDMPPVAVSYLARIANRAMNLADDGDVGKDRELRAKVDESWAVLYAAQLRQQASNAMQSPAAQQLQYRGATTNPMYPGGKPS